MSPDSNTDITTVWEELIKDGGKIVYVVLDGAGGLHFPPTGKTAYQAAYTPYLDGLALESSCGLLEPVGPGITPGSGPGHLALFGYDPLRYRLGRGVLSALGIDFPLREGDVAARVNFATRDANGTITDRRAGRIDTELNRQLCQKINDAVRLDFAGQYYFEPVAEHRAVFVVRGEGLDGRIGDTDPQSVGVPSQAPRPLAQEAETTAQLIGSFIEQVHRVLAEESRANTILMRGFHRYVPLPSIHDRFGLRGLCIAQYPMYRGVSRLLGMDVAEPPHDLASIFSVLADYYESDFDFFFLHVKGTDSRGEDGDFHGKVAAIEEADKLLPRLRQINPDVLVITSDHSTPAVMAEHSWHPVPVMIRAKNARVDGIEHFDEYSCLRGSLGLRPGVQLLGLALAHAGRLRKFGA